MAIDTEARRRSAVGFSLFRIRLVPDGTIDASDRRHCAGFYAGISTASGAVTAPVVRAFVYAGAQLLRVYAGPQALKVNAGAPSGQVWTGDD